MSERKPKMSEARRKVLNLLEFCLEMNPDAHSVDSVFYVLRSSLGGAWSDEEMVVLLQGYADDLTKESIERWNNEGAA
jgi:hypothetical protein